MKKHQERRKKKENDLAWDDSGTGLPRGVKFGIGSALGNPQQQLGVEQKADRFSESFTMEKETDFSAREFPGIVGMTISKRRGVVLRPRGARSCPRIDF
ncbi:hypothetical protein P5V15_015887 [Pogonomyrmex californicus]